MTPAWSKVAGALRGAVMWRERTLRNPDETDAGRVFCLDQRMAAARHSLAQYGVDLDDEAQVMAAVAGVLLAWEFEQSLARRVGGPAPQPSVAHVLALESLARFAPEEVLTGG